MRYGKFAVLQGLHIRGCPLGGENDLPTTPPHCKNTGVTCTIGATANAPPSTRYRLVADAILRTHSGLWDLGRLHFLLRDETTKLFLIVNITYDCN